MDPSIEELFLSIFNEISFTNKNETSKTRKDSHFSGSFHPSTVLQCFIHKKICLEEYKKILSALKTQNLRKNQFSGVEFYFEKNIIFSIKMYGIGEMEKLEICMETLFQISQISLQILSFSCDLQIKTLKIIAENDLSIYDYPQDFKDVFGIFFDLRKKNDFPWRVEFKDFQFLFEMNRFSLSFKKCAISGYIPLLKDLKDQNDFKIKFNDDRMTVNGVDQLCEYLDFFIKCEAKHYKFYLTTTNTLGINDLEIIWKKIQPLKKKLNKVDLNDILIFEKLEIDHFSAVYKGGTNIEMQKLLPIVPFLKKLPPNYVILKPSSLRLVNVAEVFCLIDLIADFSFKITIYLLTEKINRKDYIDIWEKITSQLETKEIEIWFKHFHIRDKKVFLNNEAKFSFDDFAEIWAFLNEIPTTDNIIGLDKVLTISSEPSPKISPENFIRIWNLLEQIPSHKIKKQELSIDIESSDFLNNFETVSNSAIPIHCNFNYSPSKEDASQDSIDFQNFLKKVSSLANKQKIQLSFNTSLFSLKIIPYNLNQMELIIGKCTEELFLSALPFLEEHNFVFHFTKLSFSGVKSFKEFSPKFKTIAEYPFTFVDISFDYINDFSFLDYKLIFEIINSKTSKIKEVLFDCWSFKRDTMKIDLRKSIYRQFFVFELINFLSPQKPIIF